MRKTLATCDNREPIDYDGIVAILKQYGFEHNGRDADGSPIYKNKAPYDTHISIDSNLDLTLCKDHGNFVSFLKITTVGIKKVTLTFGSIAAYTEHREMINCIFREPSGGNQCE